MVWFRWRGSSNGVTIVPFNLGDSGGVLLFYYISNLNIPRYIFQVCPPELTYNYSVFCIKLGVKVGGTRPRWVTMTTIKRVVIIIIERC